jgi:hypothetical protein
MVVMPIGPLLSGLATLAGSGLAVVKSIRDDKRSRYPPEYMMYRDMMKMARKGYPMNPMMMQMMMGNMNPYQMQQQTIPFCMLPQQQMMMNNPNQQLVNAIAQVIQQNRQQQLVNQIAQTIVGVMNQQNMGMRQGCGLPPPPQQNNVSPLMNFQFQMPDFSSMANKQLWDTPADGGNGDSYRPAEFPPMVIQPPMAMPPPPPVQQVFVQEPVVPTCQVNWCEPQQMIQNPQPQHPMYVNRELTWDTPNMYSVDQTGFQSFMDRLERNYYSDDGRYGNVW